VRETLAVAVIEFRIPLLIAPLLDRFQRPPAHIAGKLSPQNELVADDGRFCGRMHGRERNLEGERARPVRPELNGEHLIGMTGKRLAGERDPAALIAHPRRRGGEIQPASEVRNLAGTRRTIKIEQQITEWLIALLISPQPVFRHERVDLRVPT
jgi:hypothetical protein